MPVRAGSGLSTDADPLTGATRAAAAAAASLDGAPADLVVVFASGAHLSAPEATLEGIHDQLAPGALIGCGAGGVLGDARELESGTAVAVWAASLNGGVAHPFHGTVTELTDGAVLEGMPAPSADAGLIMLADPYSFPTDAVLDGLARDAPGVPILGGVSSARTPAGAGSLFLAESVLDQGVVGVCLEGVRCCRASPRVRRRWAAR